MPPKPRTEPAVEPAPAEVVELTPPVEDESALTELEAELHVQIAAILHEKLYGLQRTPLSDGNLRAVVEHDYDDHGMTVEFRVAPYFQPTLERYRVAVTFERLP